MHLLAHRYTRSSDVTIDSIHKLVYTRYINRQTFINMHASPAADHVANVARAGRIKLATAPAPSTAAPHAHDAIAAAHVRYMEWMGRYMRRNSPVEEVMHKYVTDHLCAQCKHTAAMPDKGPAHLTHPPALSV